MMYMMNGYMNNSKLCYFHNLVFQTDSLERVDQISLLIINKVRGEDMFSH